MKTMIFSLALAVAAPSFASDYTVIDSLVESKHFVLESEQPAACPSEFSAEVDETNLHLHGLTERSIPLKLVNQGETKIKSSGNFLTGLRATTLRVNAKSKSFEMVERLRKDFVSATTIDYKYLKIKMNGEQAKVQIQFDKCEYVAR